MMAEKVTVVRGPDWKWHDHDGGEGSTGTVIKTFRHPVVIGSKHFPGKTVAVQWSSGVINVCRVGAEGAYDLRILDNSDAGVVHPKVLCDCCNMNDLRGIRWKCTACHDYDLCSNCYMSDKHNIDHKFWRIQAEGMQKVKMPKRRNAVRIQLKPSLHSDTSAEAVLQLLQVLSTDPYYYYRDHLPILELPHFDVDDMVLVDSDIQRVKLHQADYGGWNNNMIETLGKVGKVLKVFSNGVLKVVMDNGTTWNYSPLCLAKVEEAQPSANVLMTDKILDVLPETVEKRGAENQGNQHSCLKKSSDEVLLSSSTNTALHDALIANDAQIIEKLIAHPNTNFRIRNNQGYNVLHQAAFVGNVLVVEATLQKSPDLVDEKNADGNAAIHLSVRGGHLKVTETLMKKGYCDLEVRNEKKETPLLLATKMSRCSEVELLVFYNADINAQDEAGNTSLHLALLNQRIEDGIVLAEAPAMSRILSDIEKIPGIEKSRGLVIACFLAQKGGNLKHKNSFGKTPLDFVISTVIRDILQRCAERKPIIEPIDRLSQPSTSEVKQISSVCVMCSKVVDLVRESCGHQVTCRLCSSQMEMCIICKVQRPKKGSPPQPSVDDKESQDRIRNLEVKLQEIEDAQNCAICFERRRNVAFLCGHGACATCAKKLRQCHLCSKPIQKYIYLY